LYPVDRAPKWYTRSDKEHIVNIINIVETNVIFDKMSPTNMLPTTTRANVVQECRENDGAKITRNLHCEILDEIVRRDGLEYDPSRDYAIDDDSDSDNNDDDDNDDEESDEE
jgi:hypothetical protein